MSPILGNIIVIAVLAVFVGLAIRSIWRSRKSGGCGCGCESCAGCPRASAGCGNIPRPKNENK